MYDNCSDVELLWEILFGKEKILYKNISLTIKCQLIMMQMSIGFPLDMGPTYYGPINLTQTQNVYWIIIVTCGSIMWLFISDWQQ